MIKEHLKDIKYKVLVLSGKGGVGKSTVSGQLSYGLAANLLESDKNVKILNSNFESKSLLFFVTKKIGVLDIDICGPSLPQVFGVQDEQVNYNFYF